MVKNFKELFDSLGFTNKTFIAVTQRLHISSFEHFKGRNQLLKDLNHATLHFISRREQERLFFALSFLSTEVGGEVYWDKWIEDNEFEASRLTEYIDANTPEYGPVLKNQRMVPNLIVGEEVLVGETLDGKTIVYRKTTNYVLNRCFACNSVPANLDDLMKCRCGRFAYCSFTCQKVHWKNVHMYLCRYGKHQT